MEKSKETDGIGYILDQVIPDIMGYDKPRKVLNNLFTDDNLERAYAMAHGIFDRYTQKPMAHLTGAVNTVYAIPDYLTGKNRGGLKSENGLLYSSGDIRNIVNHEYQKIKDSANFWYNLGYNNYNEEAKRLEETRPYAYNAGKTMISTPIALRKFSPVRLGNNVVREVAQGVKEHEGGSDILRRAGWGVADTFFPGIKNWGKRWSEEN